jgi:anaerobic selenocysteine-containing dehydrogenase
VILPPAGPLERDHCDLVFNTLAIQDVAKFSPAVFPRPDEARHDWEILNELTWRLAGGSPTARARARVRATMSRWVGVRGMLALALRRGPRGAGLVPFGRGLTLGALRRAPHGLVLGPLEPCLPGRLQTKDRRIDLAPDLLVRDLPRLERALERFAAAPSSLMLIGRRDLRSNNSWMHNSPRLMKGAPRCTLLMHPGDAAARGLGGGMLVRVRSRAGEVVVPLELTADIAPGVVSLPHGWGHGRLGVRLAVATAHPGASLNDLTDELRVDEVSGNAAFNGTPVEVSAAEGTA